MSIDIQEMVERVKRHPDHTAMGMIASHLGVVRGTSLGGGDVRAVSVSFNSSYVEDIRNDIKDLDGIVEVLIQTSEGVLEVGEDIMAVVVGGDTREHVFPALMEAVNRIKSEAVAKDEIS